MIKFISRTPTIDRDEVEHIIGEMVHRNMSSDLANMFLRTENIIDMDDIFIMGAFKENEFYEDVFKNLFQFFIQTIEFQKDEFTAMEKIINKLDFTHYIPLTYSLNRNEKIEHLKSYYQSKLLDSIIHYLIDLRLDDALKVTLISIKENTNIPGPYIINSIYYDERFELNFKVVKFMIENELIDITSFIDNMHKMFKIYDTEFINDVLYDMFVFRENILLFLQVVYSYFIIYPSSDKRFNCDYIGPEHLRESIDYLKRFIKDIIITDIERDFFYEYVSPGRDRFQAAGDKYRSNSYSKLYDWYADNLESDLFMNNFLNNLYVDIDGSRPLDNDELLTMGSDLNTIRYIVEMDHMTPYDLFVRTINLSRFELFTYRRERSIGEVLERNMDNNTAMFIRMALDNNLVAFLLYL